MPARLWSAAGHAPVREISPWRARFDYATSSLGIIDLLSVLPPGVALFARRAPCDWCCSACCRSSSWCAIRPAMRSLLAAVHAERRTLFGCLVILIGAVLTFATLMYVIEHEAQPDKFGSIPLAMWWAIVTLGTVGYGDVVPVTAMGKTVASFAIVGGLMMIALPVAIISGAFANEVRRHDFIVTWGMLARVPLFAHLRAAEIADIMRLLRAQTIETGEILVRRGEPAASMYFIAAGEVEIELPSAAGAARRRQFLRRDRAVAANPPQRHRDRVAQVQPAGAGRAGFPRIDRAGAEARRACSGSREGAACR